MFVYADETGRDWVRWAIPNPVAEAYGFAGGCDCCAKTEPGAQSEHAVLVDTLYTEVDWFLERE